MRYNKDNKTLTEHDAPLIHGRLTLGVGGLEIARSVRRWIG